MDKSSDGKPERRDEQRDPSPAGGSERERGNGHEADSQIDAGRGESTHRASDRVITRCRQAGDGDDRHRDEHREQRDER
jgi:hypothetical protein